MEESSTPTLAGGWAEIFAVYLVGSGLATLRDVGTFWAIGTHMIPEWAEPAGPVSDQTFHCQDHNSDGSDDTSADQSSSQQELELLRRSVRAR